MSDEKSEPIDKSGQQSTLIKIGVVVGSLAAITTGLATIARDGNTIWDSLPFSKRSTAVVASPSTSTAPSPTNQKFYVIAAQSEYPEALRQEPIRAAGLDFTRSFPNIQICPSKVNSRTYYLVLGSNLSQSEAQSLRQQAIANNFRSDTYLQSEQEIFFVPSNCSPVTK